MNQFADLTVEFGLNINQIDGKRSYKKRIYKLQKRDER